MLIILLTLSTFDTGEEAATFATTTSLDKAGVGVNVAIPSVSDGARSWYTEAEEEKGGNTHSGVIV